MDINELSASAYGDLFGNPDGQNDSQQLRGPAFRRDSGNVDILNGSTTTTTTQASSTDTTTTVVPGGESTTTTTTKKEGDADILSGDVDETKKGGRRPKYDFQDATGYFEDRIKNKKFVTVVEDTEEGPKDFIPKTPEEFDEFIDTQVNYQLEQKQKEIAQKWYGAKSPAWQAVARFSEMVDDPTEIIPFLQGVRTLESVENVNEEEIEGAEKIIRVRMEQRGDSDDIIDETIESLKTTDKLLSTAKKYKPIILQEEKQRLAQMVQQKKQEEAQYYQVVESIRENSIKAIETPLFGKHKLKKEEKYAIYDLIAEPDENEGGYKIYGAIDKLFEKNDFETLKQIALLIANKDTFLEYAKVVGANAAAEGIQRKLRVSTESRGGSSHDPNLEGDQKVIKRNQYTGVPRFGRGE